MNWKDTYTKLFLKELGLSVNEAAVKEYMPLWWKNTREKNQGGLRLTEMGFDVLTQIASNRNGVRCANSNRLGNI